MIWHQSYLQIFQISPIEINWGKSPTNLKKTLSVYLYIPNNIGWMRGMSSYATIPSWPFLLELVPLESSNPNDRELTFGPTAFTIKHMSKVWETEAILMSLHNFDPSCWSQLKKEKERKKTNSIQFERSNFKLGFKSINPPNDHRKFCWGPRNHFWWI